MTTEEVLSENQEQRAVIDMIRAALGELPKGRRKKMLTEYYLEEKTYATIAAQERVPIGTVMSNLSRGRQTLREALVGLVPA